MPLPRCCCCCLPFGRQRPEPSPDLELQPRPPKHPTQSQPAAPVVGGGGGGDSDDHVGPYKRVFPVQTSYLNPWKACEFLDNTLGEGTWKLEVHFDFFSCSLAPRGSLVGGRSREERHDDNSQG